MDGCESEAGDRLFLSRLDGGIFPCVSDVVLLM
jgi:hypothetical protein